MYNFFCIKFPFNINWCGNEKILKQKNDKRFANPLYNQSKNNTTCERKKPKLVDTSSIIYTLPLPKIADVKAEKEARARAYELIKKERENITCERKKTKLVDTSSIFYSPPLPILADVKAEKKARARAYELIKKEGKILKCY
jgi:hypothetical protein